MATTAAPGSTRRRRPRPTIRVSGRASLPSATWLALGDQAGKRVTILRLAGIYGPGRNALDDLRAGEARRIDKPGQLFNRIHVDDIGTAIDAALRYRGAQPSSMSPTTSRRLRPRSSPMRQSSWESPPAARAPFAEADISPMARSFYGENKRVSNARLKTDLGVRLAFPTYREGLAAEMHASS